MHFSPKARGKKHGLGSLLITCILWLSSELHKALFLPHPVQQLFTLPGQKFLMMPPELQKCPQSRQLFSTRCITAHLSSHKGPLTGFAQTRAHPPNKVIKSLVYSNLQNKLCQSTEVLSHTGPYKKEKKPFMR